MDTLSSTNRRGLPLIVIAAEREALGLVDRLGLRRDRGIRFPRHETESHTGFYRGHRLNLAITGVLEHHMSAATALVLSRLGDDISSVINFGAVGFYPEHPHAPGLGDVVMVGRVHRFDVDDNLHWARPIELHTPDGGLRTVECVTGSRYSTPDDRRSAMFPAAGQVEDMELYGLAVLLRTFGVPLVSVKYVVNAVSSAGRNDSRKNITAFRREAENAILRYVPSQSDVAT